MTSLDRHPEEASVYKVVSFKYDSRADIHDRAALEANPPFNVPDWGGKFLENDKLWAFGAPRAGNANYWIQHFVRNHVPANAEGVAAVRRCA